MVSKKNRKLFEELDLLAEPVVEVNPFLQLGLDPAAADRLLLEDRSGVALKKVVGALYRALLTRYHTDIPGTGSRERFDEIEAAHARIEKATGAVLLGWAKPDARSRPAAPSPSRQQERAVTIARRAADLVRQNMELGQHPQHFSQFPWAQGVLLRRDTSLLLARPGEDGGLQVLRGERFTTPRSTTEGQDTPISDFQSFLRMHGNFAIPDGTEINAFMDGAGRATLLGGDLRFLMDITRPVADHRERNLPDRVNFGNPLSAWSRASDPVLLRTRVSDTVSYDSASDQAFIFPWHMGGGQKRAVWNLPSLEIAGTLASDKVFRDVRHGRDANTRAITGARQSMNHFGMAALPVAGLVESEIAQYSPLITPGRSLLLYEDASRMPVATDTIVEGMIGNGSQFAVGS